MNELCNSRPMILPSRSRVSAANKSCPMLFLLLAQWYHPSISIPQYFDSDRAVFILFSEPSSASREAWSESHWNLTSGSGWNREDFVYNSASLRRTCRVQHSSQTRGLGTEYHCCIRSLSQKCQTPRSGSHRPANHDAIKLFRIFIIETTGALEEQNWNIRTRFLSTPWSRIFFSPIMTPIRCIATDITGWREEIE